MNGPLRSPRPLRLIHTADLHLGATLEGTPLIEEQALFLEWLVDRVVHLDVDALLVSGDLFDLAHPSAEAQRLFYDFLGRLRVAAPECTVVLTAGNHDSPSRLEAPRELLDSLRIVVVGSLPDDAGAWSDALLVPIRHRGSDPDAPPGAVIAAVPYLHEYRLGISAVGRSGDEFRAALVEGFASLYRHLAEETIRRWGDVPRIAMGHLTIGRSEDDAPRTIHQVGTIDALPVTLFGDAWDYVALGHIHRPGRTGGRREIRYAGTPVPIAFKEGTSRREIRLLEAGGPEIDPADAIQLDILASLSSGKAAGDPVDGEDRLSPRFRHEAIPVPTWRPLLVLEGEEAAVRAELAELRWETPFPPLLRLDVDVTRVETELERRFQDFLEERFPDPLRRPRIGRIRQRRPEAEVSGEGMAVELERLTPEEVFRRLHLQRTGAEPREDLLIAFRTLVEGETETR